MERPRVTIDATVLATTVRIDAGFEADVRTVIVSDNRARAVAEELRARQRIVFRVPIGVRLEVDFFEAVRRIASGAAMGGGEAFGGRGRDGGVSVQRSVLSVGR